jgi:hypothetical protein
LFFKTWLANRGTERTKSISLELFSFSSFLTTNRP